MVSHPKHSHLELDLPPLLLALLVVNAVLFIAVLKELEGLARRGKDRDYIPLPPVDPEHAAKVAEAAKLALVFLRSRSPGVRCVTSRGTVIHTSAFAMEEDSEQVLFFFTELAGI
jgi:hypothetical protein